MSYKKYFVNELFYISILKFLFDGWLVRFRRVGAHNINSLFSALNSYYFFFYDNFWVTSLSVLIYSKNTHLFQVTEEAASALSSREHRPGTLSFPRRTNEAVRTEAAGATRPRNPEWIEGRTGRGRSRAKIGEARCADNRWCSQIIMRQCSRARSTSRLASRHRCTVYSRFEWTREITDRGRTSVVEACRAR